ncbi:MAG: hypothetical protein WBA13_12490 [Microcoleaceae cyanobacterium]
MTQARHNPVLLSLLTFASIGILNLFGLPKLNVALSQSTELLSQNFDNSAQPVYRSTIVPMRLESGEGMYTMIVPNSDITQSAYGGELSLYDVHIAKMIEVTYDTCQQMKRERGMDAGSRTWFYQTENGSINIENLNISCSFAEQIVETYGLGKPEPTVVKNFVEFQGVNTETRLIPILDITGSKVPQWINFASGFKPR